MVSMPRRAVGGDNGCIGASPGEAGTTVPGRKRISRPKGGCLSAEPFTLEQEIAPSREESDGACAIIALQYFAGVDTPFEKALGVWRVLKEPHQRSTIIAAERLACVQKAIDHVLFRIRDEANVSNFLGVGTESYSLLTNAKALLTNQPVDEVREEILPGSAAIHRSGKDLI
jgi:hypothetical protein